MKITLKKLTAIFLAVVMLISVFAMSASAADKDIAPTGSASFKFTDNQNWGSVYVYAWNDSGDVTAAWPGDPGNAPEINGYGETVFTIDVPDGATGCVINNGQGAQTTDITDFSVEGYYTDGSTNEKGHYVAIPWPGSGGDPGSDPGFGGDGNVVKFTDNQRWGTVYVHYWGGSSESQWPGVKMTYSGDDGYGNDQYSATIPSDTTWVVFTKGKDGPQTADAEYNSSITGYYTDGKTDTDGKFITQTWSDGGGSSGGGGNGDFYLFGMINGVENVGEGDNWQELTDYHFDSNGDNTYTLTTTFSEESYVAVKSGDCAKWYMTNGWLGTDVTDAVLYETKVYKLDGVVDENGEPVANKLYVPAGDVTFTLVDNGDDTLNISYISSGGDYPTDPQPSSEDPQPSSEDTLPSSTDPYEPPIPSSEPTPPVSTDMPQPSSSDVTQPSSSSAPVVTDPPQTSFTFPSDASTEPDENQNLYVSAKSNLNTTGTKVKINSNYVTVTYSLMTPMGIDDCNASVYYDSSKLELSTKYNTPSTMFSVAKNATYNLNAGVNEMAFNFSTTEGGYDFTNGATLVSLVFTKKEGAVGTAGVYLNVTDLNSKTVSYVENGDIKNSSGIAVGPTVTEAAPAEPQTTIPPTGATNKLTINASSNINNDIQKIEVDKSGALVIYELTVPELIAYGRGIVTYDSDKLALETRFNSSVSMFSTLNNGVQYNLSAGSGTMMFDFTSADAATNSGTYDFRNGGKLVSLLFTVKEGATGEANVHLILDEFGSFNTDYFEDGAAKTAGVTAKTTVTAQEPATVPSDSDNTSDPSSSIIPTSSDTGSETTEPTSSDTTIPTGSETTPTGSETTEPSTPAQTQPTNPKPTNPKPTTPKPAKDLGPGANGANAEQTILKSKNDKDPKGSAFNLLQVKNTKTTKNSIKITYKKPSKTKKFVIYGNMCGKSYKKLKTTTGKSFTYKKLKKGKYYKFLVMALDKKGKVVSTSKTIHVATKGGKVGNTKKITITNAKSTKTIKKGKTFKLKTKLKAESKKLKVKEHRKVAFESSKTSIAKVSKKGKITAKKKGTCYIYAYAQNGVMAKVKIKVTK